MITASFLFLFAVVAALVLAAYLEFGGNPAKGIVMKAEGDGGSNSSDSGGGFDDIDYDLPF
jgi:hypothetical protein